MFVYIVRTNLNSKLEQNAKSFERKYPTRFLNIFEFSTIRIKTVGATKTLPCA